jgi:hypothetical protein
MRKSLVIAALDLCCLVLAAGVAAAHPRTPRLAQPQILSPIEAPARTGAIDIVTVDARSGSVLSQFSPLRALGAGVDGVPYAAVPEIYTAYNVRKMLGAGFGPVSYRLYTELSVQDWHWNPAGRFSEAGGTQGYWTSSAAPGTPTVDTFGYRLPRRGFTHDQGNDDDYSRLDDGDPATVWKSNPYLASAYTGDPDGDHPQWVLVDLGSAKTVDAARIVWAAPYAVSYAVQYWTGDDPIYDPGNGAWVSFPAGAVSNAAGGTVTLSLGDAPRKVEYVRIVMSQSSGTCTVAGSTDPRDCTGYAIAELGLGTIDATGGFTDLVKHAPNQSQTITYASSVDPWHTAQERVTDQEQPGFDTVFLSGVTRGLPATIPIPMLYSTPANAAAEIAYLEAQGYAIARVEMGEEPDGQYVTPEDDAALYAQFATALHRVDPKLQLGGPVFQSNLTDVLAWADAAGQTSWTKRFLAYLDSHGHLGDFNFFSFEHYPFASCTLGAAQANLVAEPRLVKNILDVWKSDNLPAAIPIFITETNYSQNETDAAQTPVGAIWYADLIGSTLGNGGSGVFFYEYEPIPLSPAYPCKGWGTYGVLLGDAAYTAQAPLSQYFAANLLATVWAQPVDAPHALYPAEVRGDAARIGAYPLKRPDGSWSVLLVNRDLTEPHKVQVSFDGDAGPAYFSGPVAQSTFGKAEYGWIAAGQNSHPNPDNPATTGQVSGGAGMTYTLAPASITVLQGQAPGL